MPRLLNSFFVCGSFAILLGLTLARGQPFLVYDQQSSTNESNLVGGPVIQQLAPYGQSFTPSLTEIGFVRLMLYDNDPANGLGASLHVNLRSNSIAGQLLDATVSIPLSNGFAGVVSFTFSNPVPLVAETIYFLEPIVESGDLWNITAGEYNYPRGIVYAFGSPASGSDIWFREGVITVPEPSSVCLGLAGAGALLWWRWRRRRSCAARP